MKRRARISIRNSHLGQCHSIEDGATIIRNVAQNHAFAHIEAAAEGPFLPLDRFSIGPDRERNAFGLRNVERFEVLADAILDQVGCILAVRCLDETRVRRFVLHFNAGRQTIDSYDFHLGNLDDAAEVERMSVEICRGMIFLVGVVEEEPNLGQTSWSCETR